MPASNPKSPLRTLPRTAVVDTTIKSISPIGPNTALVRFETRRRDQDAHGDSTHAWASILAYRFTDAPMTVEDRLLNPLGFQVVRYRRDPEVLTPLQPPEIADRSTASTPEPSALGVAASSATTMNSAPNAPATPATPTLGAFRPRP